jgi:hypothetical protein
MLQIPETIYDYVNLIQCGPCFSQANYGDGEWACIVGDSGKNCDGSSYAKDLQNRLIKTLREPKFTYFGHNCGIRNQRQIMEWWSTNFNTKADRVFPFNHPLAWKEIISEANLHGGFDELLQEFDSWDVLVVGPKHLRPLRDRHVVYYDHFVEVPGVDAYLELDRLVGEIREVITDNPVDLILFSAGMTTNVLMWELLPSYGISMLDMGACFDPYVGVNSRKGYRKPEFQDRMSNTMARLMTKRNGRALPHTTFKGIL